MQPKKILIIDDEEDIREVAALALEATGGCDVVSAACGHEGIETARREKPDAILLDVMMPEIDGPSTFAEMQKDPELKDIPVIFLTAKVQSAERRAFFETGARGVIAKPFDPMTLYRQLESLLG